MAPRIDVNNPAAPTLGIGGYATMMRLKLQFLILTSEAQIQDSHILWIAEVPARSGAGSNKWEQ